MRVGDTSLSAFDPTVYVDIVGPTFDRPCAYYWASLPSDPVGQGRVYVRPR